MRLRRPRLTILTMMVVVAISAIVMDWLRPLSRSGAETIAEAQFLKIPGASRWIGRYRLQAGPNGTFDPVQPKRFEDGWAVELSDPRDGIPLARYHLSSRGKIRAVDFAPGKFYELAPTRQTGLNTEREYHLQMTQKDADETRKTDRAKP